MNARCLLPVAAASLLLLLVSASTAPAQVTLRWKFPDKTQWKTTSTQTTSQTLSIGGLDIQTSQKMTMGMTTSSGTRRADGTIDVRSQFTSLQSKLGLPFGVELSFDSEKKTEPEGTQFDFLIDVFAAMAKMQFTSTYDKNNRLVEIQVDQTPFADLGENAKAILKDQIESEYLAKAVRDEMAILPDKPIEVGDTWDRSQTTNLSGGQSITIMTRYKYEGTVTEGNRTLHKISAKATKVDYEQDESAQLKVSESDLKIESKDSYLLFDAEKGQIARQQIQYHITGDLKLDVNGAANDGKLDLKIGQTSVVQ